MRKKALILDLDNTIYSARSIGDEVFASLFKLIGEDPQQSRHMDQIREELLRRPFQTVARDRNFSEELTRQGIDILKELTYTGKIEPFEDYAFVKGLSIDRFLVTAGFLKLQQSKIEAMKLLDDFIEVHIVDPSTTDKTKKDVFADILDRKGYALEEVLVAGDDPGSEIRAAQELGIDAVIYDHFRENTEAVTLPVISSFAELPPFLDR